MNMSDWNAGHESATELLGQLPGPLVPVFAARLLRVQPDPEDNPSYDGGFRAALFAAL
ncbi:hypothetical protein [Gordonia sp. NB41Y]|uniref:hypothetical protein n=1 Tax=Gordonia sp. NB41Y TaxID=875808 RepID=UPI0002BD86B3|nr:hypothetical protein [Gordonia sp. NB41Y]WLP93300.1 hypothetical protein Q9K23_18010 [Gordonia sp. NB41Y]